MGKAPKEKIFNTYDKASYLVKRSKSLRYRGKIDVSIKTLETASLNFLAAGNKKEFFLTNVQILILSMTHDKKRDYEKEINELENYNSINKLRMNTPILVLKIYYNYKKNNKDKALGLLNNHLRSVPKDEFKTWVYFLSLKLELLDYNGTVELVKSLGKNYKRYQKKISVDNEMVKKVNSELLSKATFNLGKAYFKSKSYEESNNWLLKNYRINKELQHYVKLISTLDLLTKNFKKLGFEKKSTYYRNLKKFYTEFLKSL